MQTQRRDTATDCRPASRRPTLVRLQRERPRPSCVAVAPASTAVPLIAREHELAELRVALAAALGGHGSVVLLAGEPGIGKTRLTRALADDAAARGVPVWWGRCAEEGSAPSFWPWSSALRRGLEQTGAELVRAAAGPFRDELAHVFPGLTADGASSSPREDDSERGRFRLFELVWRFLTSVAAPAGLVIVLDDLQWADLPSLRLLELVASDVAASRLLVVATCRDTASDSSGPFAPTLARLAREPATRRLTLDGLSAESCAQFAAASGVAGDPATVGAALHRETAGNPFYLGELVRLLASETGTPGIWDPSRLPHDLREVIARRLAPLGNDCRHVLEVAALLDEPLDAHLLARILDGEVDEAAVLDHLARAARDRILIATGDRPDCYEWAHGLLRRVLADRLPPSQRAAWHARIAIVLERHAANDDGVTTRLVRHFAAAGTPAALRRAFDYACRGAEQAARGFGWEEAVRLHELALDLATRCDACDAEHAIALELALARALRRAGDAAGARIRCEHVLDACRRVPRPSAFARAALLLVGPTPEFGRVVPSERALLEEACRDADALDDGLRARLFARLAGDIFAAGENGQAKRVLALCTDAAEAARRAGDSGALAMALLGSRYAATLGLATAAPGERPRVARAADIIDAAEAGGEHEIAAAIRHLRAMGRLAVGDRDGFNEAVDALATAAANSHAPEALWLSDALGALRATLEGRFAAGRQCMDRALATGRRLQVANAAAQHLSQWMMWHHVRGRLQDVAHGLDVVLDEHVGGGAWQPVRAWARFARGDIEGARTELHTMVAGESACGDSGVMRRVHLGALAFLCAALDERSLAPALYERALLQTDKWIVDGIVTIGPWDLARGALALVCQRPGDAVQHLEQALALAQLMRARPFVALAQALLAEALRAHDPHGTRARVAALLEGAQCEAEALGLDDVAARVARLRSVPIVETACGAAGAVFRRDGEVWSVAFAGREVLLRDGKGPTYLATLLAAPSRDVHVLELACAGGAEPVRAQVPEGLEIADAGGAIDDAPDADARRAYRARVIELRAEIDDADEMCDRGRAERLRVELDFLVEQLAQSFGGRVRTRGPAETARKAVTKVLRTQIAKLLDVHPALGEHLRASLRMGTFCSYAPAAAPGWEIAF
jgi:hypothetical protein